MKDNMLIKEIERLAKENKELEIKCKQKSNLIKGLENQLWEYEEDYDELEEKNGKLIKEVKELKYEKISESMKIIAEKMDECINSNIIKLGIISMKSCLDTIELFEKEIC